MCNRCDYLIDRFDIVGCDRFTVPENRDVALECLRPEGHTGPHLVLRHDGRYMIWKNDLCPPDTCEGCDSEDPTDYCLAYDEVTAEIAERLIASAEME